MFTAALTIAKIQKQPKCLMMDEWIYIYIHTHTHTHTHTKWNTTKPKKEKGYLAICNNINGP